MVQVRTGVHHRLVVVQRLSLAHEDHVAHAHAGLALGAQHGLGDLTCAQVSLEAELARGAEGAAERAARLRRQAERDRPRVPNQHGLDDLTRGEPEQQLARAVLGPPYGNGLEQRSEAGAVPQP